MIDRLTQVPHTNLLLVVVNMMDSTCYKRLEVTPVNILPSEYTNGTEEAPCHKLPLNDLKRRRLEGCFTEHPLEYEIDRGVRRGVWSDCVFVTVLRYRRQNFMRGRMSDEGKGRPPIDVEEIQ